MSQTNRNIYPATQRLAEFAAALRYEDLPDDVLRQIPVTLIDLVRVASVGVRMRRGWRTYYGAHCVGA